MAEQSSGSDFPITPIQGTLIVGISNAAGGLFPLFYAGRIGLKTVLTLGHLAMAICLFMIGLSVQQQWDMTSFILIVVFIISYQLSTGSHAWIYVPEVCIDSATGLSVSSQFINCLIITLTFEYMINSALKVHGSFWFFSACSFVGFIFCLLVVKET